MIISSETKVTMTLEDQEVKSLIEELEWIYGVLASYPNKEVAVKGLNLNATWTVKNALVDQIHNKD